MVKVLDLKIGIGLFNKLSEGGPLLIKLNVRNHFEGGL